MCKYFCVLFHCGVNVSLYKFVLMFIWFQPRAQSTRTSDTIACQHVMHARPCRRKLNINHMWITTNRMPTWKSHIQCRAVPKASTLLGAPQLLARRALPTWRRLLRVRALMIARVGRAIEMSAESANTSPQQSPARMVTGRPGSITMPRSTVTRRMRMAITAMVVAQVLSSSLYLHSKFFIQSASN